MMISDDEYQSSLAGAETFLASLQMVADEKDDTQATLIATAREAVRRERQHLEENSNGYPGMVCEKCGKGVYGAYREEAGVNFLVHTMDEHPNVFSAIIEDARESMVVQEVEDEV